MINLEVYTREKPKLTSDLIGELGIRYVKTIYDTEALFHCHKVYREIYRWVPWPWDVKEAARPYVNMEVSPLKSGWSIYDERAADRLFAAQQEGLVIPERYIVLTGRYKGTVANATAYRFLKNYSDLEKVTAFEPLWGILKLTQGQRSYHIFFETPVWASQESVTKMCELAATFAQRFNGIVWGEGQFGPHDPTKLYQLYNRVNERVTGLLGKFFDVYPVETE